MNTVTLQHLDAGGVVDLGGPTPRGHVRVEARNTSIGEHHVGDLRLHAAGTPERLRLDANLVAPRSTQVDVEATIRTGPRTVIDLEQLHATRRGVDAQLEGSGRITVADDDVSIDDLALSVGEGRIVADGRIRRHGPSSMRVDVDGLDLSTVDQLLPGPRMAGTLDLQMEADGSLAAPTGRLHASTRGLAIGDHRLGDADGEASLSRDRLDARVRIRNGLAHDARIEARLPVVVRDGKATLRGGRRMRLTAEIDTLDLAALGIATNELHGKLDATLRIEGRPSRPVIAAEVDIDALSVGEVEIGHVELVGSYLDEQATVRVDADGPIARGLSVAAELPVSIDLASRRVAMHPDGNHHLAVVGDSVDLGAPRRWRPDWPVDGTVDLKVLAHGTTKTWEATADIMARELALRGQSIGAARLGARLGPEQIDVGLRASGPAARLLEARIHAPVSIDLETFEPKWDPREDHHVEIELRDVELATLARLGVPVPVTGRVAGRIEASGRLHEVEASIDIAAEQVAWRSRSLGEIVARVDYDGTTLVAWAQQSRTADQFIRAEGRAPMTLVDRKPWVRFDPEGHHELNVHAAGIDERFVAAFVDLPGDLQLDAAARVAVRGNVEKIGGAAQIRGSVQRDGQPSIPIATLIEVGPREQSAWLLIGPHGTSALKGLVQARAPIAELVRGQAELASVPFEATVQARDFQLLAFEPVLPTVLSRIEGTMDARAEGSGTLGRPQLSGRVDVRDMAVTVVPMHQRISQGRIVATFEGSTIRLEKLQFRSGRGSATAQGRIELRRGDTHGRASLVAKNLPIVRPGLPLMELDTKITAHLDTTPDVSNVRLVLRGTHIDVRGTNVSAPLPIPTSDDVVFANARGGPGRGPSEEKHPIIARDMQLRFELAEPATILGPKVDMEWDGAVVVTRAGKKAQARGELSANRGRVSMLGNDFDITQGQITMPDEGDLDPYVSVVAQTEAADAVVTMTVRGRVSRPELRFSSEPPMPESEIFALLVTGSRDAEQGDGSDFETEAASLLAAFQNPALQRALNERVGIDRVGVGFGEEIDQPIVTVGKRLSRKVYVETQYHHNAPDRENQAEASLEYRFAPPAWSVETFFGDAAQGGVELWWQRRFGGGKRQHPADAGDATAGRRTSGRLQR